MSLYGFTLPSSPEDTKGLLLSQLSATRARALPLAQMKAKSLLGFYDYSHLMCSQDMDSSLSHSRKLEQLTEARGLPTQGQNGKQAEGLSHGRPLDWSPPPWVSVSGGTAGSISDLSGCDPHLSALPMSPEQSQGPDGPQDVSLRGRGGTRSPSSSSAARSVAE